MVQEPVRLLKLKGGFINGPSIFYSIDLFSSYEKIACVIMCNLTNI